MASASYQIVPTTDGWGVKHDGSVTGPYATKEAAFEAAVSPAANAIKSGLDVTILVPGRQQTGTMLGAERSD